MLHFTTYNFFVTYFDYLWQFVIYCEQKGIVVNDIFSLMIYSKGLKKYRHIMDWKYSTLSYSIYWWIHS